MTTLHTLLAVAAWTPFEDASSGGDPTKRTVVNSLYQVSILDRADGWTWLSIVRRDRLAVHDWRHMQRIKNELCGPEREAIELYPAESRLVDTCNQYHLWVLPAGMQLPIGYAERDVSAQPHGAHKQRPFDNPPNDLDSRIGDQHIDVMFPRQW